MGRTHRVQEHHALAQIAIGDHLLRPQLESACCLTLEGWMCVTLICCLHASVHCTCSRSVRQVCCRRCETLSGAQKEICAGQQCAAGGHSQEELRRDFCCQEGDCAATLTYLGIAVCLLGCWDPVKEPPLMWSSCRLQRS